MGTDVVGASDGILVGKLVGVLLGSLVGTLVGFGVVVGVVGTTSVTVSVYSIILGPGGQVPSIVQALLQIPATKLGE